MNKQESLAALAANPELAADVRAGLAAARAKNPAKVDKVLRELDFFLKEYDTDAASKKKAAGLDTRERLEKQEAGAIAERDEPGFRQKLEAHTKALGRGLVGAVASPEDIAGAGAGIGAAVGNGLEDVPLPSRMGMAAKDYAKRLLMGPMAAMNPVAPLISIAQQMAPSAASEASAEQLEADHEIMAKSPSSAFTETLGPAVVGGLSTKLKSPFQDTRIGAEFAKTPPRAITEGSSPAQARIAAPPKPAEFSSESVGIGLPKFPLWMRLRSEKKLPTTADVLPVEQNASGLSQVDAEMVMPSRKPEELSPLAQSFEDEANAANQKQKDKALEEFLSFALNKDATKSNIPDIGQVGDIELSALRPNYKSMGKGDGFDDIPEPPNPVVAKAEKAAEEWMSGNRPTPRPDLELENALMRLPDRPRARKAREPTHVTKDYGPQGAEPSAVTRKSADRKPNSLLDEFELSGLKPSHETQGKGGFAKDKMFDDFEKGQSPSKQADLEDSAEWLQQFVNGPKSGMDLDDAVKQLEQRYGKEFVDEVLKKVVMSDDL